MDGNSIIKEMSFDGHKGKNTIEKDERIEESIRRCMPCFLGGGHKLLGGAFFPPVAGDMIHGGHDLSCQCLRDVTCIIIIRTIEEKKR